MVGKSTVVAVTKYFPAACVLLCLISLYSIIPDEEAIIATSSWYVNTSQPAQHANFDFLISQSHRCEGANGDVLLVILVHSKPTERAMRTEIRESWASEKQVDGQEIVTLFVLGRSNDDRQLNDDLVNENKKYGDIILVDFIDSYDNLTLKTVACLQWTSQYCRKSKYFLKMDSDMMVNIRAVAKFLRTAPSKGFVTGEVAYTSPIRFRLRKWHVSRKEYPYSKYPPYMLGTYLLSMDVVQQLYATAKHTMFYRFEDVYIGICLRKINLTPRYDERFQVNFAAKTGRTGCEMKKLFVGHHVVQEYVHRVWEDMLDVNKVC
ncbi:beta-1,3-galactosyltransferase 1-like [Saccoglossus kowalevskii]|uniref:Hexosyltransferase n=1 Tax=Saccoglossus kowalevskii TaxID=10224 RepID=A0ABM0M7R3_SACKO|nr:PREDICTED: beta-1,3-galactosyltransferase 1-like [Saccoglossus kowalevskii]